jgi:hypothetical protein
MLDFSLNPPYHVDHCVSINRTIQEAASPAYESKPKPYPSNSTRSLVLTVHQLLNQTSCSQEYCLFPEGAQEPITAIAPQNNAQSSGPGGLFGCVQEGILPSPPDGFSYVYLGILPTDALATAVNQQPYKPYVRQPPGRPRPPASEQALAKLQQGQAYDDVYGWWLAQQSEEHKKDQRKRFREMVRHARKSGYALPGKQ